MSVGKPNFIWKLFKYDTAVLTYDLHNYTRNKCYTVSI